jgi:hypothetical protein
LGIEFNDTSSNETNATFSPMQLFEDKSQEHPTMLFTDFIAGNPKIFIFLCLTGIVVPNDPKANFG